MFSESKLEISNFYEGSYTNLTYGSSLSEKFEKIINLPLKNLITREDFYF